MSEPSNECEHDWVDITTSDSHDGWVFLCTTCKVQRTEKGFVKLLLKHTNELIWAYAKPTRAGWYWLQHTMGLITPMHVIEIVEVGKDGYSVSRIGVINDFMLTTDSFRDASWAGPLHPPSEDTR